MAVNQRPLQLQLLEGGVQDKWEREQAEAAEDEANKRAQAEALTKKQRIALQVRARLARGRGREAGLLQCCRLACCVALCGSLGCPRG